MSRSRSMSRYAYSQPAPRWPWALLLLAVVAIVGVVVLVRADQLTLPVSVRFGRAPAATAASTPDPAAAAAATPGQGAAAGPPAATGGVAPGNAAPAAPPSPQPTAVPPDEVAARFVELWNAGEYDAMYDLLTDPARRQIARADFVARYVGIADRAQLTSLKATVAGALTPGRDVPIRVDFDSKLVGRFSEDNEIPLVRENGAWKIAWTPGLIFKDLGSDGCVDIDAAPAQRGAIYDRTGEPLAYDGSVRRVGVVPGQIPPSDEARVLKALGDLTGMSATDLKARYANADPTWFVPVKDFPESRGDELLNIVSGLPGVSVHSATARIYPLGAAAAHLTGYVSEATAEQLKANPDLVPGQIIGQAGVEAGADPILTGTPAVRLIVVSCAGRTERSVIAARPAVPARDVVLTVDRGLQQATDAALRSQGDVKGSAVVLDPRTGAVLALASLPSYDPNGFVLGFSPADRAQLSDETRRPLLDRAAQAAYPTGSIFKVITFSAAMEDLKYTPETVIDCPSTFTLDGAKQVWQDWTVAEGLGPQGPLTLHQALVNSCNTVFYQIGRDLDRLDPELLPKMTKGFGLGAPTDIPYLPEVGGTVPDPAWKLETFGDYWATGDAVNLAIGQGFLEATPLQMATAYAAIANGGDLLRPYVVAQVVGPNNARETVGQRVVRARLPISQGTLTALQDALHDQTSDWNGAGSVRVFGDFGWPIAGKTGTAQNQLVKGNDKPHSWFAAFGPFGSKATIASIVMIENAGEGVTYAAPVTRQIFEAYLKGDLASGG